MSAVLGIMRSHRGMIKVKSEPGKGTTFTVFFPALPLEEAKAVKPGAAGAWRGSGVVLLIDDEEAVRSMGERLLERLGFDVVTAADGLAGLEIYRARGADFALVLCDLTMPRMDGVETLRGLRGLDPSVRVVIASGYGEQGIMPRFSGMNLNGFIQKPYRLQNLRAVMQKALGDTGD